MKKKLVIIFIFLLILLNSCSKENRYIKQNVVDFLSKEVLKTLLRKDGLIDISHYTGVPVFVLSNDSLLIHTRTDYLYDLYNYSYKNQYKSFNNFLFKSLNQEIIFDKKDFVKYNSSVFKLDNEVKKNYKTKNFIDFYNYYIKKDDKISYLNRDKVLNTNEYFSVIYYLFINNYYTTEDDYIGRTYVHNWPETPQQTE